MCDLERVAVIDIYEVCEWIIQIELFTTRHEYIYQLALISSSAAKTLHNVGDQGRIRTGRNF